MVGMQKSVSEAEIFIENALEADRGKAVRVVGLQAAQVKYVVRKMQDVLTLNESARWKEVLESFIPPMSEDGLLSFAMSAHERFEQTVLPHAEEWSQRLNNQQWIFELEEALLGARRTVMQQLSKHPAMRPYQLFQQLRDVEVNVHSASAEEKAEWNAWKKAELELEEMVRAREERALAKDATTVQRLMTSRDALIRKRQEGIARWSEVWKEVHPVLEKLANNPKTFEKLENAQLRMLQLYLANVSSARAKDVHGAGLSMLLQWMVRSLEEKNGLKLSERAEMRDALLRALENPTFVNYFEENAHLDTVIEANHRETVEHPAYRELMQWDVGVHQKEQECEKRKTEKRFDQQSGLRDPRREHHQKDDSVQRRGD